MNMPNSSLGRAQLLSLRPEEYLKKGWYHADDTIFSELSSLWATAAAEQMKACKVAAQEVEVTLEAFLQMAPYYKSVDSFEFSNLASESLHLAAGLLGQPNNPGLVDWVEACAAKVLSFQDLKPFLVHFRAISLQYPVVSREVPS
jgi:hypothetical protein